MVHPMKVRVDESKCIGAGQCVMVAPEVFDQRDEDGVVILLDPEPMQHLHGVVRDAAKLCPSRAITLIDEPDND
jgi:ferredoxin